MRVVLYVDAEAVEGQLVKGYGTADDRSGLLSGFLDTVEKIDDSIYIARVPSDSNPADAPSRGDYAAEDKFEKVEFMAR